MASMYTSPVNQTAGPFCVWTVLRVICISLFLVELDVCADAPMGVQACPGARGWSSTCGAGGSAVGGPCGSSAGPPLGGRSGGLAAVDDHGVADGERRLV